MKSVLYNSHGLIWNFILVYRGFFIKNLQISASVLLLVVFFATENLCAWQVEQIQKGRDRHKLSFIFIPSGFSTDMADLFEKEVAANLKKMWQNNFFASHKQRFDIFRVDDQYDAFGMKSPEQILALIDEYGNCRMEQARTCQTVYIVVQNKPGGGQTYVNYVQLGRDAKRVFTLAHELSVHVLGNLHMFNGPIMKDEYLSESNCKIENYTYTIANAHDICSNEKWADLVQKTPFKGAAYCPQFFRPTERSIARGSNNRYCCPIGYKAARIGLAKRTHDGSRYDDLKKPTVNIFATKTGFVSSIVEIEVNASDLSGIDRVELYASIDHREYRSVGIDRKNPAYFRMNLDKLGGKEIWFRVYVYDGSWNYWGFPDPESQFGPYHLKRQDNCEKSWSIRNFKLESRR